MNILLSFAFAALIYMTFPFAIFFKRTEKYSNKEMMILLICNSVIIKLLIITIEYKVNHSINLAPAIFYFFINESIWCNKNKIKKKSKNLLKTQTNHKNNIYTEKKTEVINKERKIKNKKSLKFLVIYLILAISIIANIAMILIILSLNSTITSIKSETDSCEEKQEPNCKLHMQLTPDGAIWVCD